jgi:hypothetical protein
LINLYDEKCRDLVTLLYSFTLYFFKILILNDFVADGTSSTQTAVRRERHNAFVMPKGTLRERHQELGSSYSTAVPLRAKPCPLPFIRTASETIPRVRAVLLSDLPGGLQTKGKYIITFIKK